MAKGEKSMERGQLMTVDDWITAHRMILGAYIHVQGRCTNPWFWWSWRWLSDDRTSDMVTLTRGGRDYPSIRVSCVRLCDIGLI